MKIIVQNLGFAYPNGKRVFEHLNLEIEQGRILSILGPNGAGKSTLLSCIVRLQEPNEGDVLFSGRSFRQIHQLEIAQTVGFVPQSILPSFGYSVLDYVVTGCAPRMGAFQKPRAAEYEVAWNAIEAMNLQHIAEQSCLGISGGERQQAAIARVIAQQPAFILLDEPTAHLDFGNQMKVLRMLRQLADAGYGVVMTTHNPDHVLLLDDQVAVLDQRGRMISGPSSEILTGEFLSALYGTQLRLMEVAELGRKVCIAHGIAQGAE